MSEELQGQYDKKTGELRKLSKNKAKQIKFLPWGSDLDLSGLALSKGF